MTVVQDNIGKIIEDPANVHRDAIHIAVLPVSSDEELWPGQYLRFGYKSTSKVLEADPKSPNVVGIVDPFLTSQQPVKPGQTFYMFMLPNTITGLRHDWTHPVVDRIQAQATPSPVSALTEAEQQRIATAVAEQLTVGPQKQLLIEFAHSIDVSYEQLMTGARSYLDYDDYMVDGDKFEGVSLPAGFWEAYQAVTGKKVPKTKQGHFFSCSC